MVCFVLPANIYKIKEREVFLLRDRAADQEDQEVRSFFGLPKTVFDFSKKIFMQNLLHFRLLYLLILLIR